MYKTRILPVEEWYKLKGTEAEFAYEYFDVEHTSVMVIEKDRNIIATWSLVPYYHAECVWISNDYRGNPTVAKRLLVGMRQMAAGVGVSSVITTSISEQISKILEKINAKKLPGIHYVIHFGR
jgi:N-acyl-L-homoserine lactone synthetase